VWAIRAGLGHRSPDNALILADTDTELDRRTIGVPSRLTFRAYPLDDQPPKSVRRKGDAAGLSILWPALSNVPGNSYLSGGAALPSAAHPNPQKPVPAIFTAKRPLNLGGGAESMPPIQTFAPKEGMSLAHRPNGHRRLIHFSYRACRLPCPVGSQIP
jgi:hypothetical protein